MTEWGVFLVITALVTFAIAIIAPIVRLNTTITKLTVTVESLSEKVKELTDDNKEAHKRLWAKMDDHEDRLDKHEIAIQKLEDRQKR